MSVQEIPEHMIEYKEDYRGYRIVISYRGEAWPGFDVMEITPRGLRHRFSSWADRSTTVDHVLYRARLRVDQTILWEQKNLRGEIWRIQVERQKWQDREGR